MSNSTGIFTNKHVLILTRYRLGGTFRLGMPQILFAGEILKIYKDKKWELMWKEYAPGIEKRYSSSLHFPLNWAWNFQNDWRNDLRILFKSWKDFQLIGVKNSMKVLN